MNKSCKTLLILAVLCLLMPQARAAASAGDGHADAHGHGAGEVTLSDEQLRQSGLEVTRLEPSERAETLNAPGIVRYNDYRTADVTSLIDATLDARHVRLGDRVRKGDALMTLKSSALARAGADWLRAQAEYRKSRQEIERIRPLAAEGIVSQARLQQSASAYETARAQQLAARATLVSYGLPEAGIARLEEGKNFGLVTLRAAIGGTVVADEAVLGQHIAAGSRLMRIVDESTLWVEVNLPPAQLSRVEPGAAAMVMARGEDGYLPAEVVGIHHELDAATRTAVVRLEVDNASHTLHAGMFVDAQIRTGSGKKALLLPQAAVQQQGTEQIVFVEEEPGRFERREVDVVPAGMGQVAVNSGLKEGENVVTHGSFVLLSELLKSGFEAHQH